MQGPIELLICSLRSPVARYVYNVLRSVPEDVLDIMELLPFIGIFGPMGHPLIEATLDLVLPAAMLGNPSWNRARLVGLPRLS